MVVYCIVKIDIQVHIWRHIGGTLELQWGYIGGTMEIHRESIGFALDLHWVTPEGGVVHARGGSVAVSVSSEWDGREVLGW